MGLNEGQLELMCPGVAGFSVRTIRTEARLNNRPKCYGRLHSAIHEYPQMIPLAKRLHVSQHFVQYRRAA